MQGDDQRIALAPIDTTTTTTTRHDTTGHRRTEVKTEVKTETRGRTDGETGEDWSMAEDDAMQVDHHAATNATTPRTPKPPVVDACAKYHCDHCQRDITDVVRIRCVQCPDFDLCVECFAKGIEKGNHLNSHPYRVLDKYANPLLVPDWGADEELMLLEALQLYGMGNWADVATHVGSKTLDECRDHYIQCYINSDRYPLPNLDVYFDPDSVQQVRQRRAASPMRKNVLPPVKDKVMPSQPTIHDIQGYMPLRREFDVEYENDAEIAIKDMIFTEEDTPADIELKLTMLEIYNTKLDKRLDRRKFMLDRNFLDFRKIQNADRRRTKEEKDRIHATKPYARLLKPEEYTSFVTTMVAEHRLRQRIAQLQEYRRHGIRTLKQAEQYEAEKKQRLLNTYSKSPFTVTSDRISKKLNESNPITFGLGTSVGSPARTSSINPKTMNRGSSQGVMDIQNLEGVDILTTAEQCLVATLRIAPKAYLAIKEIMLRENTKRGGLKRREARELVRMDVNKTGKVYDFFVSRGWITEKH